MVALALSRSLLDQEVEKGRAKAIEVLEVKGAELQMSLGSALHRKPAAGDCSSVLQRVQKMMDANWFDFF